MFYHMGFVALFKLSRFFDDAKDVDELETSRVEHDQGLGAQCKWCAQEDRSSGSSGTSRTRRGSTTRSKGAA
jgi:hypothetical protein